MFSRSIKIGKTMMYIHPGHEWHGKQVRVVDIMVFCRMEEGKNPDWCMTVEICCDGICSSTSDHFEHLYPLEE